MIRWFIRSQSPNAVSLVIRSGYLPPGVTWRAAGRVSRTRPRSGRRTSGRARSPPGGVRTLSAGWFAQPARSVTGWHRPRRNSHGNPLTPLTTQQPTARPEPAPGRLAASMRTRAPRLPAGVSASMTAGPRRSWPRPEHVRRVCGRELGVALLHIGPGVAPIGAMVSGHAHRSGAAGWRRGPLLRHPDWLAAGEPGA